MACTLLSLPNETLLAIARFLPVPAVGNLVRTCRFLARLLDTHLYDRAPNYTCIGKQTVLEWAAEYGHLPVIRKLMTGRRPRRLSTWVREHALMYAAIMGQDAALRLVLEIGVDINSTPEEYDRWYDSQCTVLHRAAMHDRVSTVRLLLDLGADIGARDVRQESALSYAIRRGNAAIIEMLLEWDSARALSPGVLHAVVETNDNVLLQRLLDLGADPSARVDAPEQTPLHHALMHCNNDAVKLLLERGSDVNANERFRGETPLHWAVQEGNVEALQMLLEHGADPNAGDSLSYRPLHVVMDNEWTENVLQVSRQQLIRLLLAGGADPFEGTDVGETALDVCKKVEVEEALRVELERVRPGDFARLLAQRKPPHEPANWGR